MVQISASHDLPRLRYSSYCMHFGGCFHSLSSCFIYSHSPWASRYSCALMEFGIAPICSSVPSEFRRETQNDARNLSCGACVCVCVSVCVWVCLFTLWDCTFTKLLIVCFMTSSLPHHECETHHQTWWTVPSGFEGRKWNWLVCKWHLLAGHARTWIHLWWCDSVTVIT